MKPIADINPLSSFLANAPNILGFDPVEWLVDVTQARALI
jgi:hypothetical protein